MEITATEEFLIARCLKRDPDAVRQLVERYGRALHAFVFCACGGNAEWSRIFLLSAFSQTLRNSAKKPGISFRLHFLKQFCLQIQESSPDKLVISASEFKQNPKRLAIIRALSGISWEDRVLILLRDQIHLSHTEIGKIYSLSGASVRNRLRKARTHFLASTARVLEAKKKDPL